MNRVIDKFVRGLQRVRKIRILLTVYTADVHRKLWITVYKWEHIPLLRGGIHRDFWEIRWDAALWTVVDF